MIEIDLREAQADPDRYIEQVIGGETVVLCKDNRPVAAIRAVEALPKGPRPLGLALGTTVIPPSFFEPLPAEWDIENVR